MHKRNDYLEASSSFIETHDYWIHQKFQVQAFTPKVGSLFYRVERPFAAMHQEF
jgi:hypothetical protein